jgi:hypothetical protein
MALQAPRVSGASRLLACSGLLQIVPMAEDRYHRAAWPRDAQGARHSFEPDHIAAVSVLIGDSRSAWRSAWLGAIWGIGHTVSLVAMCVAVVGFGAMIRRPPTVPSRWPSRRSSSFSVCARCGRRDTTTAAARSEVRSRR